MPKKSNPPRRSRSRFKGVFYVLFLVLCLGIGTLAGWFGQSNILRSLAARMFNPKPPAATFHADSVTLLILGCDEDRSDDDGHIIKKQARSDMMLIAKLDFKNNLITGVSIPRDTECNLPGFHRGNKINAYHNFAKKGHEAELTQRAVEFLLPGVHIDRVVTLDFDAFQKVVDVVGGVPMTVEKNMDYDDKAGNLHIHIKKGPQVMDGYTAMCFVRFRHADSDFVRQKRQKEFLIAFKDEALKHWVEMPTIVDEGVKVIGNALTTDEIASLVLYARTVPPQNIQWGQIPVTERSGTSNMFVDKRHLSEVLAQYRLIDLANSTSTASKGDE